MNTTMIITRPPSKLAVGYTAGPDWEIARRRGNRVRYRSTVTGAWDAWIVLEPGDRDYVEPKPQERFVASEPPEITYSGHQPVTPERDVPFYAMKRDELRRWASHHKIAGRGSMSKDELVHALQETTGFK